MALQVYRAHTQLPKSYMVSVYTRFVKLTNAIHVPVCVCVCTQLTVSIISSSEKQHLKQTFHILPIFPIGIHTWNSVNAIERNSRYQLTIGPFKHVCSIYTDAIFNLTMKHTACFWMGWFGIFTSCNSVIFACYLYGKCICTLVLSLFVLWHSKYTIFVDSTSFSMHFY